MPETLSPRTGPPPDARHGRLTLPDVRPAVSGCRPGEYPIHLPGHGDARLVVPTHGVDRLVVVLHGAGAKSADGLVLLRAEAAEYRLALLAPQANAPTWDVLLDGYGPDVTLIAHALAQALAICPVPPGGLAICGFSDGASYALSLGIANGDLFPSVVAFSPGFLSPLASTGRPRFFVSHGRNDPVLPADRCSRVIVPALRRAGYRVQYEEFDGGHSVPTGVRAAAARWLARHPGG